MTTQALLTALECCPLFCGVPPEAVTKSLPEDGVSATVFAAGEVIGSPETGAHPHLIVILSGKASVSTPDAGHNVLLRFLGRGDLFGIANLFSGEPFVSTVQAVADCSCVFFSEEAVRRLLDDNSRFRENYIGYLSGRIRFLNRKIGYLTAGSAERRLALYLAGLGHGEVTLTESISSLSELLNLGRASLYRAFDQLTADGFLIKNGKHMILPDPAAMLAHYQQ